MRPLSKEASDALSALQATDPTAADEARVRKNLERTLGIVIPAASVAVATTAVSAQAASQAAAGASVSGGVTAMSLGAKAVALVFAVGVGAVVAVTAVQRSSAPPAVTVVAPPAVARAAAPVAPEVEVSVEAEPVAVVEPAPQEEVARAPAPPPAKIARPAVPSPIAAPVVAPEAALEVAPAPAQPPAAEPTAPPSTQESYELEIETHFPNCDPGTEMRSALNARRLLVANRAEEAVGLLGAYQKRCPSGRWSNEAWSVRLGGLCALGRNSEVSGLLHWFSNESPERRAAVVSGLRSWCSEEVLRHGEPTPE